MTPNATDIKFFIKASSNASRVMFILTEKLSHWAVFMLQANAEYLVFKHLNTRAVLMMLTYNIHIIFAK